MALSHFLGSASISGIDVARPIRISHFEMSAVASSEVSRMLLTAVSREEVNVYEQGLSVANYWEIQKAGVRIAESFSFPQGQTSVLPTAIEIAILKALDSADDSQYNDIVSGGKQIVIGSRSASIKICRLISKIRDVNNPPTLLSGIKNTIAMSVDIDDLLDHTSIECLGTSFVSNPLKFRFVELYRVIERRFLSDIKKTIIGRFESEPQTVLDEAIQMLKSELNQLVALAEKEKSIFESVYHSISAIKLTNRFAAALFHKLDKKQGAFESPEWRAGAALIYSIRCAIVHAGAKDIVFEAFGDGDDVIKGVTPLIEEAALSYVGIKLS